ncbi:unnamed protein product [Brassica oleracea var. botrytis]|uniref:(rape) hypothetical protein n=1 Tax=Brassica napus TaxID=3708 RepID=A0A816UAT2_BRANA|nr:unnamed protein product [Brassica napus]
MASTASHILPISTSQTIPSAALLSNLNYLSQPLRSRLHQLSLRNFHNGSLCFSSPMLDLFFVSAVMVGVVLIWVHRVFRAPKDIFLDEEEQDLSFCFFFIFCLFLSLRVRKYHFG